jgi:hypothetical protein
VSDCQFPGLTALSGTQRARARWSTPWITAGSRCSPSLLGSLAGDAEPGADLGAERAQTLDSLGYGGVDLLSQTLTVAALALSGPSLSLRPRRRQSRTRRRQSRGGTGAGGSFGPPALQRGGSVVLEPADQLGGGVVGGYLAGQPDVDLDRGMVIRANVNGVGPAEDQPPDRLSDQQAGQIERAAGADWPDGVKRAQPPCPALIDADDSSAVARSPDRGDRNQLTQRFQFLPSCRSFIGLVLCMGHPPIRGGHLPAAGRTGSSCSCSLTLSAAPARYRACGRP